MKGEILNIKNITIGILLISFSFIFAEQNPANTEQEQLKKNTYAIVVNGISKDPTDQSAKTKAVSSVQYYLQNNLKIDSERLCVLKAGDSPAAANTGTSTVKNIQNAINNFASIIKPDDRFIFYYIGQANVIGENLRINLPGADVTPEQLALWMKEFKASSMLIIFDCPGSGLAAKALSGPGRVILGSCTAEQHYTTRFSEYFIPALTDSQTDMNEDGKISILEAFTTTSKKIDDWYRQEKLLTTETPVLEDNGDGQPSKEPWRYKLDNTDGRIAAEFFP
jgi:hypothetical protein